jgi:hypothetical protein
VDENFPRISRPQTPRALAEGDDFEFRKRAHGMSGWEEWTDLVIVFNDSG